MPLWPGQGQIYLLPVPDKVGTDVGVKTKPMIMYAQNVPKNIWSAAPEWFCFEKCHNARVYG
jgi:hypothetical protein